MSDTFSNEERKAIEQVQKLLAKAAKTEFEPEREAFSAKAQEIMTRLNISTATIEKESGKTSGKREEQKVDGGFYLYQRELWRSVAELNFCWHFTEEYRIKLDQPVIRYHRIDPATGKPRVKWSIIRKRHRLIGRTINVIGTKAMAEYLESAIERMLKERVGAGEGQFGSWANDFREGATSALLEKIADKFKRKLAEEQRERTKARGDRPTTGMNTTALTLTDVKENEEAGNYDFVHGDGAWARMKQEQAEDARERAEAEAAYTAWAKANPEEAKKREDEAREARRKMWSRYRGGTRSYADKKEDNRDDRAFHAGRDAGSKIGLDPQAGDGTKQRRIAR